MFLVRFLTLLVEALSLLVVFSGGARKVLEPRQA